MNPILFFDGVCGLCNCFVDFVLKHDYKNIYRMAPLQGKTAQELLPPDRIRDLDTLAVWEAGQIKIKSDAVLSIFSQLGFFWRIVSWFRILPKSFRDGIYDQIASYRYHIWKKRIQCRLPSPEEQDFFYH